MSAVASPLVVGIVAGEESGDLLGADLVRSLAAASGREVRLVGVGGPHLAALGLRSFFPPEEIALVGLGAVVARLPRLLQRIGQAARALAAAEPDCLVTIDVPDFALRVARRFRALRPGAPTIHYVCPSVWAWRPGRARQMARYVDHVLCVLPFEPAELARLGGPPGSYVGHRLAHDVQIAAAWQKQAARGGAARAGTQSTLLLLPGSRRGEIARLMDDFGAVLAVLRGRGFAGRAVLPTLPRLAEQVRTQVARWPDTAEVVEDASQKWQLFAEADAALIASGTVSLELATSGVPHVSCYRLDALARPLKRFIGVWSANLPNLIADRSVIPEFFDVDIRPGHVARHLEALLDDTEQRRWQLANFQRVRERMKTNEPAGEAAASVVLDLVERRRGTA